MKRKIPSQKEMFGKIRKPLAPPTRIIPSKPSREPKHKPDYMEDV